MDCPFNHHNTGAIVQHVLITYSQLRRDNGAQIYFDYIKINPVFETSGQSLFPCNMQRLVTIFKGPFYNAGNPGMICAERKKIGLEKLFP